jgi:hypothetical protein
MGLLLLIVQQIYEKVQQQVSLSLFFGNVQLPFGLFKKDFMSPFTGMNDRAKHVPIGSASPVLKKQDKIPEDRSGPLWR